MVNESHNLLIYFYGDAHGTTPTHQVYIEAFLCDKFRIDHFEILETAPLILEAELYLYYTREGGLAERFPPRLLDWEARLRVILADLRHLPGFA